MPQNIWNIALSGFHTSELIEALKRKLLKSICLGSGEKKLFDDFLNHKDKSDHMRAQSYEDAREIRRYYSVMRSRVAPPIHGNKTHNQKSYICYPLLDGTTQKPDLETEECWIVYVGSKTHHWMTLIQGLLHSCQISAHDGCPSC